jgi:hypothetical protein
VNTAEAAAPSTIKYMLLILNIGANVAFQGHCYLPAGRLHEVAQFISVLHHLILGES